MLKPSTISCSTLYLATALLSMWAQRINERALQKK